jgi:hypothetical protein
VPYVRLAPGGHSPVTGHHGRSLTQMAQISQNCQISKTIGALLT